jgi:hypothetical protein
MNALAWLSPGRWLLVLGLALSLWLGYHAWAAHQQGIGYSRAQAEYAKQAKQVDEKRDAIAPPIAARHQAAVQKIVTITETIIKEVPTYVKGTDCSMPGGFRVLHDAAAHDQLPDPARIADAAPAPAAAVATTVASNYGTCTEIAQRLTDLQAWVKAQQDATQ